MHARLHRLMRWLTDILLISERLHSSACGLSQNSVMPYATKNREFCLNKLSKLIKPSVYRPAAGARLVSCNHFDLRMYACVYGVYLYAPEAINN